MPEKKKRGRPPKKKPEIEISEEKESVKMVDTKPVSVGDIKRKLSSMFTRAYASNIPETTFRAAIGRDAIDLTNGFLNNPFIQNQRIKKSNAQPILANKNEIHGALQNPGENEEILRQTSMALYYNNYVYQTMVKLNRDIPQYFYYTTPVGIDAKELKTEKFKNNKAFLEKFLQKFDLPLTFKNITLQTAREGKCSYVFRSSHNKSKGECDFAVMQKLPPEYIKYTAFGSESPLVVSFNFMIKSGRNAANSPHIE